MNLAITGPTSGIGTETIKALATKFDRLFLLVRNVDKAKKLIEELFSGVEKDKFTIVHCDLSDLRTVAKAAENIQDQISLLHVLINNAGGIFPEKVLTKDGLEMTFSINHLGHFLLTRKLLPLMVASMNARIINVSSEAHKAAKPNFEDLQLKNKYHSFVAYANAKLFNILFTKSLAKNYEEQNIQAFALHPGVVNTNFGSQYSGLIKGLIKLVQPFMISPKKGAQTSIFLATSDSVKGKSGGYYKKSRLASPSKAANSVEMRDKLWEASEKLIQGY